jgi:hypothetical protein
VAEVKNYGLSGVHRTLQLGKQGPVLVGNADTDSFTVTLQDGSTLTTMAGANASGPAHFVTKAQLEAAQNAEATFSSGFDYANTTVSLGTIPAGAKTVIATLIVSTAFDDNNSSITAGSSANSSLLMGAMYNDPATAFSYQSVTTHEFVSDTEISLIVDGANSSQGAGTVVVSYY